MAPGLLAAGALLAAALAQSERAALPPPDHAERMAKGLLLFAARIEPLLKDRCLRCHGGEATRGGLNLASREGLLAGGKHGEVAVPFDAGESRLLRLVRHEEPPGMPWKLEKLDEGAIAALADWIELGAPYERPLVERKEGEKRAREVTDSERDFWSFRPLAPPPPPQVRDDGRCRDEVDRFVQARLEEGGVEPAAPAPSRALLRRLWFDLVGLPPPLKEVEAFLADSSPDAWERRVDALLESPRFGERFGRHWLDLVRFAESHGFEHDYDRPHAYAYRDFVIDALHHDQPFDEFVRWQIAGDELEPEDARAWFATGFLGAGVHATQITANQVEKERYDELDDVVATIGTSMLGLTIGCARCHDHKFDPLPTRDYYRMVATFTRTVRSDHDVVLNAAEHRAQLESWEREHAPLVDELTRFERESLRPEFEAWLAAGAPPRPAGAAPAVWTALEPAELVSSAGATFARQDDGSFLASGARAERDEYRFVARLEPGALASIASLRIETLADPSLPKGGPGRADNGNFGLTELRASWRPSGAGEAAPISFAAARSTFDQAGLPAAAAIDGVDANDSSCWAVDPEFGKDHAAAFALAAPVEASGGGELVLALLFRTNVFHSIGRLRVAAGGTAEAQLCGEARPPLAGAREPLFGWFAHVDPRWRALRRRVDEHLAARPRPLVQKALVCSEGLPAIRLHTQGGDFLESTHFLVRGDPNQKQEVATPGFLQVLTRAQDPEGRWRVEPPDGARTPWQRRALAAWITDVEEGAGALLARVAVNRLWQHLFGRGIVPTPSDFGSTGAPPSHPELLEWLARDFVDGGFRVKRLLRRLATSATYRQGGGGEAQRAADPENRLFSRHEPRRLEAEAIRDALLDVSGLLDLRMHGPGSLDVADRRRSVYLFVKRSRLVPMMTLFDAPNALSGMGRRQTTTVAPQSLFLMNSPTVRAWSEALARRVEADVAAREGGCADAAFVRRAFELCYARPPDPEELADALSFLAQQTAELAEPGGDAAVVAPFRARVDLCQALVSANEFVYVE